jgi:GntR family transcriptional regulator/MocR family aminotransferase
MARTRTSSAPELLVDLRRADPTPLHAQLERELRGAIRSGRLAAGSALPSTRALADQLALSRGVVVEAFGYGSPSEAEIEKGIQLVAETLAAIRRYGATEPTSAATADAFDRAAGASTRPAASG